MKITEIRIKLSDDEKLKAFVSITFDSCFAIRGIKIIKGSDGLFVAMPCRAKPDGSYQDLAHPINRETRIEIEDLIVAEYRRVLGDARGREGTPIGAPIWPAPGPLEGKAARSIPRERSSVGRRNDSHPTIGPAPA